MQASPTDGDSLVDTTLVADCDIAPAPDGTRAGYVSNGFESVLGERSGRERLGMVAASRRAGGVHAGGQHKLVA